MNRGEGKFGSGGNFRPGPVARLTDAQVQEIQYEIMTEGENLEEYIDNPVSANCMDRSTGNRLVHVAAACGNLDALKLLFRFGANLNVRNFDGNTALHTANSFNNYWCARFLVEYGVSKDCCNNSGIPAWAGMEGTNLFPTYTRALSHARTHYQVKIALRAIELTAEKTGLVEFVHVYEEHRSLFPFLWPKGSRKRARQVRKLVRKVSTVFGNQGQAEEEEALTADEIFEKIRKGMHDKMERIIDVFHRLDVDGSGELDRRELLLGIRNLGVRLEPAEIKTFIQTLDPNDDGLVSFHELERALKTTDHTRKAYNTLEKVSKTEGGLPQIAKAKPKEISAAQRRTLEKLEKRKQRLKKQADYKNSSSGGTRKLSPSNSKTMKKSKRRNRKRNIKIRRDIGGPTNIAVLNPTTPELKLSPFYEGKQAWNETMISKESTPFDRSEERMNFMDVTSPLKQIRTDARQEASLLR
eukprot:g8967.t1